MSVKGVLEMDSHRLAQYSVQYSCYICDGGNSFDTETCRHCQAPMALSHQAASTNLHPSLIAVLGTSGAGKTVYLGMLIDILSRPNHSLQLLARGAFSISLQEHTVAALQRCVFPEKTPSEPDSWNWVHCQIRRESHRDPVELIVPDVAGEALVEEIDHPGTYPVIQALLKKCRGAILLVDAARMNEGSKDQNFFAMKMLNYLSELHDIPREGWAHRPIAQVLTKADQCELCFDDPDKFTSEHSPSMWQLSQERFHNYRTFAASVAGSCFRRQLSKAEQLHVPSRIEPRGIIEPFEWLVSQVES